METDGKRFTEIKRFRRIPYLPRLNKIRLGVKEISRKTGKEYPREVDYFVCPSEVQAIYGKRPKILDIMFPSEDPNVIIPFCYKMYGSNQRLKCRGDGETAVFYEGQEMKERTCPCEHLGKDCDKRGHLMVILPKISLGGVYQIDTGSGTNINRILDAIDYWKAMIGRCKCIPLKLERVCEKILNPKDNIMQNHYLFRFGCDLNAEILNVAIKDTRQIISTEFRIEPPKEEGALDDTPIIYVDEEDEKSLPIELQNASNFNNQPKTHTKTPFEAQESTNQPKQPLPEEVKHVPTRTEVGNMILEFEDGDKNRAKARLKVLTTFEGKNGLVIGKETMTEISDKQVPVLYGKVKRLLEEKHSQNEIWDVPEDLAWDEAKNKANRQEEIAHIETLVEELRNKEEVIMMYLATIGRKEETLQERINNLPDGNLEETIDYLEGLKTKGG